MHDVEILINWNRFNAYPPENAARENTVLKIEVGYRFEYRHWVVVRSLIFAGSGFKTRKTFVLEITRKMAV